MLKGPVRNQPKCKFWRAEQHALHEVYLPEGATLRFWTPTKPPTNCWPEAPWGGRGGALEGGGGGGGALEGGSRRGDGGGGLREGRLGGGVQVGRFGVLGGGGRLPLPPLALPLTIASP